MRLSPISMVILLVSVLVAPTAQAQAPAADNQSAVSSAASPAQSANGTAEVPRLIKFSGALHDAQGRPQAGPVGVTFALYSQQSGGAALWLETQNVKPDENGNYTILLGANTANGVPAELFASGEARWLEVQVERQAEQPRLLLVSVPYALKAKDAETLGGLPASAFVTTETLAGTGNSAGSSAAAPSSSTASTALASSQAQSSPRKASSTPQAFTPCASVTSDGAAAVNSIARFTTACNLESSVITQSGSNVGIGTAAPAVALDVLGNNAGLRLSGTGTHQVTVTGATSGRLGQDASGFFFASDTNGKTVRFLTNNGTLNEWMRITSAGNVGIATQTPAAKLDVNGNLNSSGTITGTHLVSTVATGTAPLSVTSTTVVPNLNASFLGGMPPSAFASSGSNAFLSPQSITTNSANNSLSVTQIGNAAAIIVTQNNTGGAAAISAMSVINAGHAIEATSAGSGAISATSTGPGPALGLLATQGNLIEGVGPNSSIVPMPFSVSNAGTGQFTGAGNVTDLINFPPLPLIIGDVNCGAGDSGVGSAGIQIGGNGLTCTAYNFLGDGGNTYVNSNSGGAIKFRSFNIDKMIILANGNVGIGTTTPGVALDVVGDIRTTSCYLVNSTVVSGTCVSDARLKTNIQPFSTVLDKLARLRPVHFDWRVAEYPDRHFGSSRSSGLIAQEVEGVLPELVSVDAQGFKQVNYTELPYLMLQAFRELKAENDRLQSQVEELRGVVIQIAAAQQRVERAAGDPSRSAERK